MKAKTEIYGLLGEFDDPDTLVSAAKRARARGFKKIDAFSPFPVEDLHHAIGFKRPLLPLIVLAGALIGALAGFAMQYYASVESYPMNIGGRPLNSWPSFVPITFELAILFAAFSVVLGMFALNGLPMPYHPVFNVERFLHASRDGFFLIIESADPKFEPESVKHFLKKVGAREIFEVEP